jgi:hypothetical protein
MTLNSERPEWVKTCGRDDSTATSGSLPKAAELVQRRERSKSANKRPGRASPKSGERRSLRRHAGRGAIHPGLSQFGAENEGPIWEALEFLAMATPIAATSGRSRYSR